MTLPEAMLNLRRRYAASPDFVFRAFTEPRLLEQWLCPDPSVELRVESLDLRVGGEYRFAFHFPEGIKPVIGRYLRVDPPHKLVFVWTWEPPDPFAGLETIVSVTILGTDTGCELELTHERFPNQEKQAQHESGWTGALARLEKFLAR